MKKFNKIAAMVLGVMTAGVLCAGSAMAAELPDENPHGAEAVSSVTDGAGASDWEQELERLKALNPDRTDEEWEIVEQFNDPEANGKVLVGESERVENGHLIVDSYYIDAAVPYVYGQKEFEAYSRVFTDSTKTQLIAKMFLKATFKYDNGPNERYSKVKDGSILYFWIKQTKNDQYPELDENNTSWCDVTVDNKIKNFYYRSRIEYHLFLKLGLRDFQEYVISIEVDERGVQTEGGGTLDQY